MHRTADQTDAPCAAGKFFRPLLLIAWLALWPAAAQGMTLAWTPSTDPAVTGFKIYYGSASRFYTRAFAVGNLTSATINGLVAGATYHFAVTTCDAAGNESAFSDDIIYTVPLPATTASGLAGASSPVPTAPTPNLAPANKTASKDPMDGISASSGSSPAAISSVPTPVANPSFSKNEPVAVAQPKLLPSAKIADPNGSNPSPFSPPPSPSEPPIVSSGNPIKNAPVRLAWTADSFLANALAASIAQLYMATSAFDNNADGMLNENEQAALLQTLRNEAATIFGSQQAGQLSANNLPDLAGWLAALYWQTAPYDSNMDGILQPAEQTTLASALKTNFAMSPVFAPLLQNPAPGQAQNVSVQPDGQINLSRLPAAGKKY